MPIYDYQCTNGCGTIADVFAKMDDKVITCPHCGADCKRLIAVQQAVHGDMEYYDDNLETYIKSRKHRKQVMREKGVSERYGKGWY
jgi:putative FmdB family regulatory protein